MNKEPSHIDSSKLVFSLLLISVALYIAYFTHLSIERWALGLSSLDYARIDGAAHNTAIGNFMWTNEAHFNYWSQHIAPILFIFSAIYLFSDAYWPTFFLQTLTIGAAAIPLFFIARKHLKSEPAALLVALVYLLDGGLQLANLFDYHMLSHETLFFLGAIYASMEKRRGLYWVFIALLVICKEDAFILASMAGLYAFWGEKNYRLGIYTWLFCGFYALMLFKVGYPYLRAHETYQYAGYYDWMGANPVEIIKRLLINPVYIINNLLSNELIVERWSAYLIQHGGPLFLLSPLGLMMLAPPTMELLLASRDHLHGLTHHYPLLIVPVWSLGIVLALRNLGRGIDYIGLKITNFAGEKVPGIIFRYLLSVASLMYLLLIGAYLTFGKFEFNILDVSILMDGLKKPGLILTFLLGSIIAFCPPGFLRKKRKAKAGIRLILVILVSLVFIKLYYNHFNGALPLYSSWSRYISTVDKAHAAKVREAIKIIPEDVVIVTNPGTFALLHHHTTAYITRDGYRPSLFEKKVDYLLLDKKDTQNTGDHQVLITERLLYSKPYGLIYYEDGIAIFKRGHGKEKDHGFTQDYYNAAYIGAPALKLSSMIGKVVEDSTSLHGKAIKATAGVGGPGTLIYGPYKTLMPGKYTAVFSVKSGATSSVDVAKLDVAVNIGKDVLAKRIIKGSDFEAAGKWTTFTLEFEAKENTRKTVELRVEFKNKTDLWVDMTRIEHRLEEFKRQLHKKPQGIK